MKRTKFQNPPSFPNLFLLYLNYKIVEISLVSDDNIALSFYNRFPKKHLRPGTSNASTLGIMAKLLFKKFIFCSLGMAFILVLNAPTGWGQVTPAEKEGLRLKILGDRYLSERDTSSAIATYQKALQKIPQSSATYFNLAIAFYTKKNIRGAATALEEVLKLTPQDAEAHYNLACLRIYQHKLNQAKLHFEQAKRYSRQDLPFFPSIQQGLEFLNEIQKYDFKTRALTLFHAQGEQEINSIPVLLS